MNRRVETAIARRLMLYGSWIPDRLYLCLLFRLKMGYWPNLKTPKSFSEELQWLKLYNRRPEYTTMVDKYSVKEYVKDRIGEDYIIPTLGVWDKPEQIEWNGLPQQFVLKTTHGGGGCGIIICKDKDALDKDKAVAKLKQSLDLDIYRTYREWPYKDVAKRIIAEKYIESDDGDLKDYKFFCFNGKVEFFKVDFDRFIEHRANYYNRKGELLPFGEEVCPPDFNRVIEMPVHLNQMIALAESLSDGSPFMRVDLYESLGQVFFGEITLFPAGGMGRFIPDEYDLHIGQMLQI